MEYSIIQVALVFIVTFVAAIDQFNFLESLYQPIVTGAVIGLILGDLNTGLLVGGTYQLMTIGNMPIGGAQPPNAVIGGIMAAILAIATGLEPNAAVGLAIPFALLGQLGVTLFFIAGATIGQTIASAIPTWLQTGLSAAGGMMRFVGFAVLLKVMMNRDMWGFFLMGFGLALITVANDSLATPALLILALIGFGIAFWDFQQQTELKGAAVSDGGDFEDGI